MGSVYLSHTRGGRPVAMKVAKAEFSADPSFRQRFAKEVEVAARVQGLYTAPVVDSDAHAPRPWLATAYIPAPSLGTVVARQGPLPADTVLVLIAGVAEALQSIHAVGIVHRDLKPGNVILAADGPRVIDFGISRAVEGSSVALTATGARIGTPAFMAPEQVRGKSLGPAADVFALGALAYHAATGELPFGGDAAVFYRITSEEPNWERVPERLQDILRQCTLKDPTARPTPAQLIDLCRQATDDARLHIGEGWLPPTATAEVTRYTQAPLPPAAPGAAAALGRFPMDRRPGWRALATIGAALTLLGAGAGIGAMASGSGKPHDPAGALPPSHSALTSPGSSSPSSSPSTTPETATASPPLTSPSPTVAAFTPVYQHRRLVSPWTDDYNLTQGKVAPHVGALSDGTDDWMYFSGDGTRENSEVNSIHDDFAFAPQDVTPAQCLTLVDRQPVDLVPLSKLKPGVHLCVVDQNGAGVGIVEITDTQVPPAILASYWTQS